MNSNSFIYRQPVSFQPFVNETLANEYLLRWTRPIETNGPLENYVLEIKCADERQCYFNENVDGYLTEFSFNTTDVLTSFELHAENNQVLSGPSVSYTKQVLPVSKILLADQNSLKLFDLTSNMISTIFPLSSLSPKVWRVIVGVLTVCTFSMMFIVQRCLFSP